MNKHSVLKPALQVRFPYGRYALFLVVVIFCLLLTEPAAIAQETLKGHIERAADVVSDQLRGKVVDARTGQPIAGAHVSLPDQGFSMRTGAGGEYAVPRVMGKQPVIMSVEKPGYVPFSLSISENALPVFTIQLQKQLQTLILDNTLRHLGDGSYSPVSANALNFRKLSDGPAIRIPFALDPVTLSEKPYLQIGSVVGLDTAMGHFFTGNPIGVSASPLIIKLNGAVIAQLQVNGDNQKIQLPKNLMRATGLNTLEIESGYHYPEPGRLDYDDMELMHLVIYP